MKRFTLYTKAGCTSCIKARQFLLSQGVAFTERDIFKHPLDELELRAVIAQQPIEEVFSYRSPSVKALGLDDKALAPDDMLKHMLEEPRLIRRPLLVAGEQVVVGFNADALRAAVGT